MTTPFIPTFGARDTGKNARNFVKDNKEILWKTMKPLIPWILGLSFLDMLVSIFVFPNLNNGFQLFSLFHGYFYAVLAITWHRVVIHGPDNYVPMNPLKPKRHEWVFIGVGILIGLIFIPLLLIGAAPLLLNPMIGGITIFIAIIVAIYWGYRFSFYFPAKAVDNSITLMQAFKMSKGGFWKLFFAGILSAWRMLLLLLVAMIAFGLIVGLASTLFAGSALVENILAYILMIPALVYFYPILYVLTVTVLSNFYQYVLQNGTNSLIKKDE